MRGDHGATVRLSRVNEDREEGGEGGNRGREWQGAHAEPQTTVRALALPEQCRRTASDRGAQALA